MKYWLGDENFPQTNFPQQGITHLYESFKYIRAPPHPHKKVPQPVFPL